MPIAPFKLERYYALYEFKARIMLSSSDCESLSMTELLSLASPENKALWNDLKLGYTETQGHPLLRQEAAEIYEKTGAENLMIAAPEELIYIAMQTQLKSGDHVIALAPAYQSLYEIARSLGCGLDLWQLRLEENRWVIDLDELKKMIQPRTRMLVLNIPNNPTGFLPNREEFETIINIARQHGITIFADEMYRMLEYRAGNRLPSVCDAYERGISLTGLSKTMALPGLRIGWLATRDPHLIETWLAFKDYTTICNSAPSEVLAIIALQNRQKLIARNVDIIQKNILTADGFFARHTDLFSWIPPVAGSIAFPVWRGGVTVEEMCRELVDRHSVMLVPGSMFDYSGNHFRLGLGRLNFPEGIAALEDHISN